MPEHDFLSDPLFQTILAQQPYQLLFVTISGAHLYGFPSPDSDFDLRGVHNLPLTTILSLDDPQNTINISNLTEGKEIDLVTHDVKMFFELLLKKNGLVLEQIFSPLVMYTSPFHEELKALAPSCITRHHSHHYRGLSESQWKLFQRENPPRVKPLLYVYRALLTGIHLMRMGEVEANLVHLNEIFKLPYLVDLIERKRRGTEKEALTGVDVNFHAAKVKRLHEVLAEASATSALPETPAGRDALNDLLIRTRLQTP